MGLLPEHTNIASAFIGTDSGFTEMVAEMGIDSTTNEFSQLASSPAAMTAIDQLGGVVPTYGAMVDEIIDPFDQPSAVSEMLASVPQQHFITSIDPMVEQLDKAFDGISDYEDLFIADVATSEDWPLAPPIEDIDSTVVPPEPSVSDASDERLIEEAVKRGWVVACHECGKPSLANRADRYSPNEEGQLICGECRDVDRSIH